MSDNKNQISINVTSTAIEKGVDVAKEFIDKLVSPSVEELGLLIKDQVSFWRFGNQVKILTKAKHLCEKNNISIKAISPKLLCPYLEHASLEDDEVLQDKWAILLSNMVDSNQNIQSHVFPYILSQLSKEEFNLVESTLVKKEARVSGLELELSDFLNNKPSIEKTLQDELDVINQELQALLSDRSRGVWHKSMKLKALARSKESEIRLLKYKEARIKRKILAPEKIAEKNIKEFEIANIVRLGLAKTIYEVSAGTHSLDVPLKERDSAYASVDFDIDIDTEISTVLTELGELFIDACRDKNS